jgi:hypothetical protein
MFADLKRCARCHQRYPAPFGHRCPLGSLSVRREHEFEQRFRTWLQTNDGRFAEYLARKQRTRRAPR